MPEPEITLALLALVYLAESSAWVRLPVGLLLAIGMLATGVELLWIAIIGATGVMIARLSMALSARRGRDRLASASPAARAQRDAMRRQLSGSPAYARVTFLIGALPFMPADVIFPMLGAMRAPLLPALAGTLVGRTPVLAFTASVFAWLGGIGGTSDEDAAIVLGVIAALILILRTISSIDMEHLRAGGGLRFRDPNERAMRMTAMFTPGMDGPGSRGTHAAWTAEELVREAEDADVVEGELLGEEIDDEDDDDGSTSGHRRSSRGGPDDEPPALPPTGLAPS